MKNITTWAPAFFKHNNSYIATVSRPVKYDVIMYFIGHTFPFRFFWLVLRHAMNIMTAMMTVATMAAEAGMMM